VDKVVNLGNIVGDEVDSPETAKLARVCIVKELLTQCRCSLWRSS
jgi:hypothetical protein